MIVKTAALRFAPAVLAGALFAVLFPAFLSAQLGGGSVRGFVTDPSGASMPAAEVKAVNIATNVVSQTATNNEGYFEFPVLPAGSYHIEVRHDGFRPLQSADLVISTGTASRVDLALEVGQAASTVEVKGAAPVINTSTTDVSQVIGAKEVDQLPLNGRNWQNLIGLQAGAVASPGNAVGARGGSQFNGSPGYGNQFLLDGVDMSFGELASPPENQSGGAGTSLIGGVSVGAIEEITTNSNSFSAEYGSATGGVVNITTKSGTNDLHGEAFEFFRNDALNASDFFANKSGLAKPELRWNQFGGNLGGPIRKNSLFFFFNYEGARVLRGSQLSGNTPTPLLLSSLTPPLRENASGLPQTYTPTSNPLLGFAIRNAVQNDQENTTLSRIDYNFRRQRLTARYSHNWSSYDIPQFRPANTQSAPYTFDNVSLEHTAIFSASMFNEFRFGINRNDLDRHNSTIDTLPGWFEVDPVGLIGDFQSRIHYTNNTYTIADNFSWIRGKHSIKTGFQIFNLDSNRIQNTGMTTYYNTLADLISDKAAQVRITFGSPKPLNSWHSGFYIQDDWRATRNLLITAGLRYEYYTPLKGMLNVSTSDPFGPFIKKNQSMFAQNYGDLGPRIGFAWTPFGSQRLVIRSGAGLTYMPLQPFFVYDFAAIDPALPFSANVTPADAPASFSLKFPFPQNAFVKQAIADPSIVSALGLTLGRNIGDYNLKDASALQWNFSIQGQLTSNDALQVAYVGNHASHLYVPTNPNQFLPGAPARPTPSLGSVNWVCACATSQYESLQVSYNHRFSRGLVLGGYYTFGKALSLGTVNGVNNIAQYAGQDPYNLRGDVGVEDGDIRHLFVMNYSYAIPVSQGIRNNAFANAAVGGWSFDGILQKRSGLPVNVLAGLDLVRNQRPTGDRPNLVSGVNPYIQNTNSLQWLNPKAFDAVTPYNQRAYGNLGYNSLFGPGGFSWDASLHKQVNITERHSITFRAEAFNVLNHPVFSNPVSTVTNPLFGRITSGSSGRAFQLALKYAF